MEAIQGTTLEMLISQARILHALILREIRTRFFGHGLGFLIQIAWPLSHIGLLVILYSALGRVPPYGDSAALWSATGVVPFLAFAYMARFIMLGIGLNRSLVTFPVVKVSDILFARAIVEVLCAGAVILLVLVIFVSLGINVVPGDIPNACYALLASMLLGLGFGVFNACIATISQFWITGFALLIMVLWMGSGVLVVPDQYPLAIQEIFAVNPIFHGVAWMRSAYYPSYDVPLLNKNYILAFGAVSLCLGLALERFGRGKLLQ